VWKKTRRPQMISTVTPEERFQASPAFAIFTTSLGWFAHHAASAAIAA